MRYRPKQKREKATRAADILPRTSQRENFNPEALWDLGHRCKLRIGKNYLECAARSAASARSCELTYAEAVGRGAWGQTLGAWGQTLFLVFATDWKTKNKV